MIKLKCPSCGASLKAGENRCEYCGSEFEPENKKSANPAENSGGVQQQRQNTNFAQGQPPPSGYTPPPRPNYNYGYNYNYNYNYGGNVPPKNPYSQAPKTTDTYGTTALILALLGIFICPILMFVSISYSNKQAAIGANTASKAAKIISVCGLIFWAVTLVFGMTTAGGLLSSILNYY